MLWLAICRSYAGLTGLIDASISERLRPQNGTYAMPDTASTGRRRILWQNVSTVLSAAILISAEVFGAAFAGGWAVANLIGLGDIGVYVLQILFFLFGIAVMAAFVRNGMHIEPFTARD
jgi:hypothetical protein